MKCDILSFLVLKYMSIVTINEMKINRFEDLEVWKHSRELVKEIYCIANKSQFHKDFALRDQMRRVRTIQTLDNKQR